MRVERKYRVWDGHKFEYNVMVGFLGTFYVQGIDENDSACMSPYNTKYHDSIEVMEYINLKDKNGKEIWSGDILQEDNPRGNKYLVFPVAGGFAINIHQDDLNKPNIHFYESIADMQTASYISGSCTVIGNIYENPF